LLAAVSIVTLAAFAGLAVDSGYMEAVRRRAQTAADSAALSAAFELQRGDRDNMKQAARVDAALNGFVDGQQNTSVAIANPPVAGAYAKNDKAVEAIVTQAVPTSFMRILGASSTTVTARAVALVAERPRLAE
jgi:uncharacterized membrane protein